MEAAAVLSAAMYNEIDENGMIEVEHFECHHVKNESPAAGRPAVWAIYSQGKYFFVVFRGSDADIDWIVNACFLARSLPNRHGVKVHSGYLTEIDQEYKDLVDWVVRAMQEGALSITITGHSKGGALAHVFAERLVSDSKKDNFLKTATIKAITFAVPMAFSYKKLDDAPQLDFIHNHVISSDPVPYFPLLLGNKEVLHGLVKRKFGASVPFYLRRICRPILELVLKKVESRSLYAASYGPVGHIYLAQDILKNVEAEYKKTTIDDFRGLLQSEDLKSILDTNHHSMVRYTRIAVDRARRFQFDLDKAEKGDKDAQYYVASSYCWETSIYLWIHTGLNKIVTGLRRTRVSPLMLSTRINLLYFLTHLSGVHMDVSHLTEVDNEHEAHF
jgi:hypothetical protein